MVPSGNSNNAGHYTVACRLGSGTGASNLLLPSLLLFVCFLLHCCRHARWQGRVLSARKRRRGFVSFSPWLRCPLKTQTTQMQTVCLARLKSLCVQQKSISKKLCQDLHNKHWWHWGFHISKSYTHHKPPYIIANLVTVFSCGLTIMSVTLLVQMPFSQPLAYRTAPHHQPVRRSLPLNWRLFLVCNIPFLLCPSSLMLQSLQFDMCMLIIVLAKSYRYQVHL